MTTTQYELMQPLFTLLPPDSDLMDLVEGYVAGLQETADAIAERLTCSDLEELRILVHRLKGSAGAYGFPAITDAAAIVERVLKTSQVNALPQLTTNLIVLCRSATTRSRS